MVRSDRIKTQSNMYSHTLHIDLYSTNALMTQDCACMMCEYFSWFTVSEFRVWDPGYDVMFSFSEISVKDICHNHIKT